jgi:hypothetical protein
MTRPYWVLSPPSAASSSARLIDVSGDQKATTGTTAVVLPADGSTGAGALDATGVATGATGVATGTAGVAVDDGARLAWAVGAGEGVASATAGVWVGRPGSSPAAS